MALDPLMRRAVRLIAGAIEKYAADRGWGPADYRWFYRTNPDWGLVGVILVAEGFEGRDYFQDYQAVRSYLENALKDEPGLTMGPGIVLRTPKQVEEGGIYAIGPDYEEYEAFQPARG